ncbi:MAG: DUF2284 domain-containing protein [Patescibacteria group bacterium]
MPDLQVLSELFARHGFTDFKWIEPKKIQLAQWVRFRCQFGCDSYGKRGTCPPNVPEVEKCREMINEYNLAAIFHFEKRVDKPEDRRAWSREKHLTLIRLEREVFLAGYYKTFLITFDCCRLCADCPGNRPDCRNPQQARPGADALGIDVFATARGAGYPIEVLKDYGEAMNRYAFLLIE